MAFETFWSGYRYEDEQPDAIAATSVFGSSLMDVDTSDAPDELLPQLFVRCENQGRMNSCVGHALTTSGEGAWHYRTGEVRQFSRMFGYLTAQDKNGYKTDSGATIEGAVKAAKQDGFCDESVFPYPASYTRTVPPAAYENASRRRVAASAWLEGYAEVLQFLRGRIGLVLVGSAWVPSMASANQVVQDWSGRARGRHAWVLGGYTRRKDRQGRPYLVACNSHSEHWGENGFAEISPAAVETMFRSRRNLAVGLSHFTDCRPLEPNWKGGVLG